MQSFIIIDQGVPVDTLRFIDGQKIESWPSVVNRIRNKVILSNLTDFFFGRE